MAKNTVVFGIFKTEMELTQAVNHLRVEGFRSEDISILASNNPGTKDLGVEKGTKAPEGLSTGAVSGAIIGGALGWLTGIGALTIPGVGPFIAAGPIVAALAGAGAVGTVGGILGALAGLGIPEYEAKRYEGMIRKGLILLSIHCDNSEWTSKAKDILADEGAEDIASTGEAGADFAKADKPRTRAGV
jgi:hypothetical protein